MTKPEFAQVIAYLALGTGKSLSAEAHRVYFDCLQDLDAEVLQIAARRVLMEHVWHTFPSIAELRAAAALTQRGAVTDLTGGEAWEQAWGAVKMIDPEIEGIAKRVEASLPPVVWEAVRGMGGWAVLIGGGDPIGVLRGQFLKVYEALRDRDARRALLPPKLTQEIEAAPGRQLAGLAAGIGAMPAELPPSSTVAGAAATESGPGPR